MTANDHNGKSSLLEKSWDCYRRARLEESFKLAKYSIRVDKTHIYDTPIPHIRLQKAIFQNGQSPSAECCQLVAQNLFENPDHSLSQKIYLTLLEEYLKSTHTKLPQSSRGQLVMGIGTGRCGSSTLTKILKDQPILSFFTHEHPMRLKWIYEESRITWHLKRLKLLADYFDFFGDVSHWWLPHLNHVFERFPNTKVVVLKRDKEQTINSFMRVKDSDIGTINHWKEHSGTYWIKNAWDECYPKFDRETVEECLSDYWELYYTECARLAKLKQINVMEFETDMLNDPLAQKKLLSFCGIKNGTPITSLRLNDGSIRDSDGTW